MAPGFAVQNPSTPYAVFVIIALLCGFAGQTLPQYGEYQLLLPESKTGRSSGLSTAGWVTSAWVCDTAGRTVFCDIRCVPAFMGGTGVTQPDGSELWLQNAAWIWVPFLLLLFTAAALAGDERPFCQQSLVKEQLPVLKRKHLYGS